jgi:hypothetical protein
MTNTFTEAVDKLTTNYDSDMFLGRLVWYTVTEDLNITHKTFHETVLDNFMGLDTQPVLPGFPRPTDVFKRACTAAQVRNVPKGGEGAEDHTYNYMVRPAGHDDEHVWRVIVREEVDPNGHELSYDELVKVTFNRKTEKLRFNNVDRDTEHGDEHVNDIVGAIYDYFKAEADRITPYAVREFTRKFLERTLHSIKVRPAGGVYFVNEAHAPAIEALDRTLNGWQGSTFHFMPLIDDSKQRQMLRAAFEDESVGEVDRIVGEMAEIMAEGGKISSDRFANYKVEYDSIRKKVSDYSALLDENLERTVNRLDIMEKVLIELIDHVKV